jgi:hypothetical protein
MLIHIQNKKLTIIPKNWKGFFGIDKYVDESYARLYASNWHIRKLKQHNKCMLIFILITCSVSDCTPKLNQYYN